MRRHEDTNEYQQANERRSCFFGDCVANTQAIVRVFVTRYLCISFFCQLGRKIIAGHNAIRTRTIIIRQMR